MQSVAPDRGSPIWTAPGLEAKLAALRRPETYPHAVDRFEAIETHMSWVFLAGDYAYKLKKPVRYDFLDFSTLELRECSCGEEVRLNRRLAPEVYLNVVPLTVDASGGLRLCGTGVPVEWLVRMRRLPRGRMLDRMLATGAISEPDSERIARVLAGFYRDLAPAPIGAGEYRRRLTLDLLDCARALESPDYALPASPLLRSVTRTVAFIAHRPELFDARVAAGRIVEGHGDLRPEHVCLLDPPVVIDCLEFNATLRITDIAAELASLAVECEHLGAAAFGAGLVYRTCAAIGDDVPVSLLHYYIAQRALLRAKLAVWHTRDVDAALVPRWLGRAREYLALADAHARLCN